MSIPQVIAIGTASRSGSLSLPKPVKEFLGAVPGGVVYLHGRGECRLSATPRKGKELPLSKSGRVQLPARHGNPKRGTEP